MSGSTDDRQFDASAPDPDDSSSGQSDAVHPASSRSMNNATSNATNSDEAWAEADDVLEAPVFSSGQQSPSSSPSSGSSSGPVGRSPNPPIRQKTASDGRPIPLDLVETAFLASTASLLWLISYYLSIGPWMRIFFPAPIALVYLRWGQRSAWMAAIVSCLLLSVLMGPYLSLLFLIPYGLLGVQLGFLWQRNTPWSLSIAIGTIVATLSFFFRVWLLSIFIGEDLWVYLTGRMTDLIEWLLNLPITEWVVNLLMSWGWVDLSILGQPSIAVVQAVTIVAVLLSDIVYLFTVHLTVWLMFERLKTPIPMPPRWVQILLEEE
ncbi:MAG: DUF2232 domain-containing protein [Leptolyngbyaceae bacterium]|nr:DUF2232 domain-containing protein [Leptolyngbyaceae bacterium]